MAPGGPTARALLRVSLLLLVNAAILLPVSHPPQSFRSTELKSCPLSVKRAGICTNVHVRAQCAAHPWTASERRRYITRHALALRAPEPTAHILPPPPKIK